jgi:hypothetical protein
MAAVIGRTFNMTVGKVGGLNGRNEEVYYDDERRGCLASPFAAYYIVTFFLNGVAITAVIVSQFNLHRGNHGYNSYDWVDAWYFANAIFSVIHIMACIYIVKKIRYKPRDFTKSQGTPYQRHDYQETMPPPTATAAGTDEPWWMVEARENDASDKAGKQPWYARKKKEQPPPQVQVVAEPDVHILGTDPNATAPDSWPRIKVSGHVLFCLQMDSVYVSTNHAKHFILLKNVLMEDKLFALYIVAFCFYVAWHFFATSEYQFSYNPGVRFVEKTSDCYIVAGPASFLFSCVVLFMQRNDEV